MISIVQFAPYVWPTTGPGPVIPNPTNIPLTNAPTPGNLLVACVPLDYTDSEPVTVNPYWTVILEQGYAQEPEMTNCPLTWFAHEVQIGESANLPPFYNGFTGTGGAYPFTAYVGGMVFELSGASADFSSPLAGYNSPYVPSVDTPAAITTLSALVATDTPGSLAIGICSANGLSSPPPPWCGTTVPGPVTTAGYENSDTGLFAPWDCWTGWKVLAAPGFDSSFVASFPTTAAGIAGLGVLIVRPSVAAKSGITAFVAHGMVNWTRPWTE